MESDPMVEWYGMRTSSSLLSFRTWASGQCHPCVLRRRPSRPWHRPAMGCPRNDTSL